MKEKQRCRTVIVTPLGTIYGESGMVNEEELKNAYDYYKDTTKGISKGTLTFFSFTDSEGNNIMLSLPLLKQSYIKIEKL